MTPAFKFNREVQAQPSVAATAAWIAQIALLLKIWLLKIWQLHTNHGYSAGRKEDIGTPFKCTLA
jgi:hypothetical protein